MARVAAIFVPEIDRATESSLTFPYGAGAALAALSAIAGGTITVTGFVFSFLLLAIHFGSSQFSPRLTEQEQHAAGEETREHLSALVASVVAIVTACGTFVQAVPG